MRSGPNEKLVQTFREQFEAVRDFEEEKVLDVIDDDQSSEHRQLGNINQSHFYSLFLVEFF